jgi:hypothetical protein
LSGVCRSGAELEPDWLILARVIGLGLAGKTEGHATDETSTRADFIPP